MPEAQNFTLLIVDDDSDLRDIMTSIFSGLGFNTISSDCGTNALEIIQSQNIDLVVTDVRMPNGDGFFLLEKIRALISKPPVVIFVTGYSDISEDEFLARGASKVFLKPFNRKQLVSEVQRSLGL